MKNAWIWIVVAVIVLGGGIWYWQSTQTGAVSDDGTPAAADVVDDSGTGATQTPGSGTTGTGVTVGATVGATTGAPMTATVTFNGDAFSPSTVTIAKGGTVTFTSTGGDMWVASNPHPAHSGYSGTTVQQHCPDTTGTAFDQCAPGTSYSMTFQKVGTWGYHDHLNHGLTGTVIVQ